MSRYDSYYAPWDRLPAEEAAHDRATNKPNQGNELRCHRCDRVGSEKEWEDPYAHHWLDEINETVCPECQHPFERILGRPFSCCEDSEAWLKAADLYCQRSEAVSAGWLRWRYPRGWTEVKRTTDRIHPFQAPKKAS